MMKTQKMNKQIIWKNELKFKIRRIAALTIILLSYIIFWCWLTDFMLSLTF